ncbi:MAG: hypothetical protein A2096_01020 [Spirochaetes bacterium GWF1_41_5]|nr:MAG: hypothetical protein A2096_01020 [Spirochaetes bacterium GWF1_41_5]
MLGEKPYSPVGTGAKKFFLIKTNWQEYSYNFISTDNIAGIVRVPNIRLGMMKQGANFSIGLMKLEEMK